MKDRILTKERLEEYSKKIAEHPAVKSISEVINKITYIGPMSAGGGATLIGGAVIDIIENRPPKDYDFVGFPYAKLNTLLDNGFTFVCESAYAYTYMFDGHSVQILKKAIESFDFKISQSKFATKKGTLTIDRISFENKQLIPTNWDNEDMLKEALMRIPHWENKGYKMHVSTYQSIIEKLFNINRLHS